MADAGIRYIAKETIVNIAIAATGVLAIRGLGLLRPAFTQLGKLNRVWKLGSHKSTTKWANQFARRGWTAQQIDEAIAVGQRFQTIKSVNPAHTATRYVHPRTGRSVVVDDITRVILQVGGNAFRF